MRLSKLLDKFNSILGFSIYEDYILKSFLKFRTLKLRLTLLRAIELSAQTNETDLKRRLAGYSALSSADPYPSLKVGDGKNNQSGGKL